jgi:excisionase family DNA binding protein
MTENLPAPLSMREVAEYLGCAPATVRRLIQKGELRAVKVGGRWRVPHAAVRQLLEDNFRL